VSEREPTPDWTDQARMDPLPAPPLPQDAAVIIPPPVAPTRFCKSCGSPWDPSWMECPRCSVPVAAVAPGGTYRREIRRIKSAVGLYFAILAVSLVTVIITLASGESLSVKGELIAVGVSAGLILIWCLASLKEVAPTLGRLPAPWWYAVGAGAAVPTFLLATALVRVVMYLGVDSVSYTDSFLEEGYSFIWPIVVICVEPAIFEELAFRGAIQSSLRQVLSPWEAILVSAMMFGILHLSLPSMPHLVTIGVVLGWLREKTGSLYPGMVMHFCHNLLVVLSERWEGVGPW
jgi:uncharacterized protein